MCIYACFRLVFLKGYSPNKKNCLSQTTGWDYFSAMTFRQKVNKRLYCRVVQGSMEQTVFWVLVVYGPYITFYVSIGRENILSWTGIGST